MSQENNGPDLSGTNLIEGGPLTYLLRLPVIRTSTENPVPTLIMLHGRGANQGDIYELVQFVDKRVMLAAPRAPLLHSDDARGSFMWYENVQPGIAKPGSMETALEKLLKFIEELDQSAGVAVDRSQLYIGGFSQGAAMSFAAVSAYPEKFAGVIAHSGPFSDQQENRLRKANLRGKPFFVAHGTNDFLNIDEHGRRTAKVLEEIGADLTYKEYPIAHESSLESRGDLANWLNPQLKFD